MPEITKTPIQVESQFDKKERGKAFRQVMAAFIANIGTINTGLIFGFSAVVIPQLQSPSSSIQIDKSQASWIGKLKIIKSKTYVNIYVSYKVILLIRIIL